LWVSCDRFVAEFDIASGKIAAKVDCQSEVAAIAKRMAEIEGDIDTVFEQTQVSVDDDRSSSRIAQISATLPS